MFYSKQTGGFYSREIHGDNIPADAVEITSEHHRELIEGQSQGKRITADENGFPALADPPAKTQAQIIAEYESALDAHLDSVAKLHRYNDRFSFALRAGFAGPYQAEGIAFATWMDTCNVQAFALLQEVLEGKAELPTVEDFIAMLPVFSLP